MEKMEIRRRWRLLTGRVRALGKRKYFCVGFNKTGTTSLKRAFRTLGYVIGDQRTAEGFLASWAVRDFAGLIRYCRTGQVFQDVPFSLPYTYQVVDRAFPESKFILTVRDSSEQWYTSITRYHGKLWADGRVPPTAEDLQNATYLYKGHPWDWNRWVFDSPAEDPYNKLRLIECYERHCAVVIEYFRHRPDDLLVLNVAEDGAYQKFCSFLGVVSDQTAFPWANKTDE